MADANDKVGEAQRALEAMATLADDFGLPLGTSVEQVATHARFLQQERAKLLLSSDRATGDQVERLVRQLEEAGAFLQRVASQGGPLSGNAMEMARRCLVKADLLHPSIDSESPPSVEQWPSSASSASAEEVARLREVEHAAWHALDASEQRPKDVLVPLEEALILSKLLPEAHPGNDDETPYVVQGVPGKDHGA